MPKKESDLEKELDRVRKILYDATIEKSAVRLTRLLNVLLIFLLFAFILLVVSTEVFWDSINILASESSQKRDYLVSRCLIGTPFECSASTYQDTIVISITSGYSIGSFSSPHCSKEEIRSDTLVLYNCTIGSAANRIPFSLSYKNPQSGLTHHAEGTISQFIEITTVKRLLTQ
jgi:hypothetical protein